MWQKFPKHGRWYDNMNNRYIKTDYRKSEKLFYFEDTLNKSISLWKREYSVEIGENLTHILWEEYEKIQDYTMESYKCNAWDSCIPWAMYVAFGETKTLLRLNLDDIIVGEIEERFRRNFSPENSGIKFQKEYLGFREKKLADVILDEYMNHFGLSFKNNDDDK